MTKRPRELGDHVHDALAAVGITPERVTAWLGVDCGCQASRIKLNQLSAWARRVLRGDPRGTDQALAAILARSTER